jgi:hypothetical protein
MKSWPAYIRINNLKKSRMKVHNHQLQLVFGNSGKVCSGNVGSGKNSNTPLRRVLVLIRQMPILSVKLISVYYI